MFFAEDATILTFVFAFAILGFGGYFVYRFYPVSFGRKPDFAEFTPDLARVSGFLTDDQLEAAKVAPVNEFMARPIFTSRYPTSLTPIAFVDQLITTAGVTVAPATRDGWIQLAATGSGRSIVFRQILESTEVYQKYYNQAFVVMQYFGYLRRDPDALYLNWIQSLDSSGDYRVMVNGFVNAPEYRFRFGP